jgi:hypothetical protein
MLARPRGMSRTFPAKHVRSNGGWRSNRPQIFLTFPVTFLTFPSVLTFQVLALFGTVHGSFYFLYTLSSVSRSAGLHSLNLRGQR